MISQDKLNAVLAIGDRLVIWTIALALVALFWWHDREFEMHSPILLPPCTTERGK